MWTWMMLDRNKDIEQQTNTLDKSITIDDERSASAGN